MRKLVRQQKGQTTLLSVIAMGSFLAVVITFVTQYTSELSRLSHRSKENLLIQAVIEDIGVELRRAYDMARETGNTCAFSVASTYGTANTVGATGASPGLPLCLKTPGQVCISRSGSLRSYCASYNLMETAANESKDFAAEPVLVATIERQINFQDWRDFLFESLSSLPRLEIFSQAHAQKSDFSRPPLPNPASTANSLNPLGPNSVIRCASDGAPPTVNTILADCISVRICDSDLDCTQDKNIITQRFAFIRN